MTKLIYRGINYKSQKQNKQTRKISDRVPSDKCGAKKKQNFDKLISIKPIHYYTYRGVSYTKSVVSDRYRQVLLNIERQ